MAPRRLTRLLVTSLMGLCGNPQTLCCKGRQPVAAGMASQALSITLTSLAHACQADPAPKPAPKATLAARVLGPLKTAKAKRLPASVPYTTRLSERSMNVSHFSSM
eukprot:GHRR01011226.1.p1 GENE.GHRR01011226.1~~GHRR01011226.1.p1  ORF type:complete len:106 (-),score=9.57 GHRR01011226.1:259-576(-)